MLTDSCLVLVILRLYLYKLVAVLLTAVCFVSGPFFISVNKIYYYTIEIVLAMWPQYCISLEHCPRHAKGVCAAAKEKVRKKEHCP